MDDFRGTAHMIEVELLWQSVGRIWPWIALAIGALVVVAGAVLFSP
jgi:hypothetical protein